MAAEAFAFAILTAAALYLLVFGLFAVIRPHSIDAFLSGFAQTWLANITEAAVRALVGIAIMLVAPSLPWPLVGQIAGVFLIGTAAWMLLYPDAHRRIAIRSVGWVRPNLRYLGIASVAMGATFIAWGWTSIRFH